MSSKSLIFKRIPKGYSVPGEDLTIEPALYDENIGPSANGIVIRFLYASFDPLHAGSHETSRHDLVVRSNNVAYKEGDLVIGQIPIQEVISIDETSTPKVRRLENPLGLEDIRVFLGALGMPGLTAFSSFYKIGKPSKGETIFISAASGAVGQVVDYILNELGFDGGFNYKKETPASALARLAPQGLDIYHENVGGEHLEATIDAMNPFGRIIACGMISEYNSAPHGIKNLHHVITKRLEIRGFIVADPGFADSYMEEHQKMVQKWITEGTFKALTHETVNIENAAKGLVGIFYGRNRGKAVLKV
ncbi:hypothetical protein BBP40_002545 [Aspergillus hancockii]|nr:hypothetical protein BBP40_002545 [Aspergillus hancockii]